VAADVIAVVRDLVIIVVGLLWIVAGVIVTVLAWATWKFVKSLPGRAEAVTTPVLEVVDQARQAVGTAGEGARTAKEAIGFVSEKAVVPTIGVVSVAVAVRRFFAVLFGGTDGRDREPSA
jgi:hypothetical protein